MRIELDQSVDLADGARLGLTGYEVESIAADPDGVYPAGSGATVRLQVDGTVVVLTELSSGYDSSRVGWSRKHRVELLAHGGSPPWVDLAVDRVGPEIVAGSSRKERVTRGGTVTLDGDIAMKFRAHGHKHVMAGGPKSPLIVRVTYLAGERSPKQADINLWPPEKAEWRWQDHRFRLLDYSYDDFMALEVARLQRTPVAAAAP